MSCPVRYAHGNILFGQDWQPAALFRMDTVSNRYLGVRENYDLAGALAEFAYGIEAHFSLYRVNRAWPVSQYREQAAGVLDEQRGDREGWFDYLASHEERIGQLQAHVPEVYVVVQLTRPTSGMAAGPRDMVMEIARRFAPTKRGRLAKREITELQARANDIADQYRGRLGLRAATTRELQWLFTRTPVRGVTEPDLDEYFAPPALQSDTDWMPLEDTTLRLTDHAIREEGRTLHVDADVDPLPITVPQAMLTLGALPEVTRFPGDAELLSRPLEACPFPVDVVMHCRWLGNQQAAAQVRSKVNEADTVLAEQKKAGRPAASSKALRNRVKASEFLDKLESPTQAPILVAATSFAVGAPNTEILEKRVAALKRAYGRVKLHRPVGLQPMLFRDHYVRTDLGRVRTHQDRIWVMDPDGSSQFGAMMPIGTHHAGDDHGPYIGYTVGGVKRPIRLDITQASRSHRPPTMLFAGTSGSGKTTAAEYLVHQARKRGSATTIVDPKGDNYLFELPEYRDVAETIVLSGDPEFAGALDPLVISPEAMREDLTASYLMDLLPSAPSWTPVHIRQAIKQVLQTQRQPGCLHVVETLKNAQGPHAEEAHAIARALEVFADSGVARLAFSDGRLRKGEVEQALAAKATRFNLKDLTLPAPGAKMLDEAERLGVATLKLALTRAVTAAKQDLSRHDVIYLDEAHVLLDTPDGLKFVDKLTRTARALNITLILASQHVTDAGTLEDLVGYRFVFGQETERAAKQAIQIVGLDPNDKGLVRLVMKMRQGRCLFRDLHGRVAEMQVDLVDQKLLEALNTDPNAERHRVPLGAPTEYDLTGRIQ